MTYFEAFRQIVEKVNARRGDRFDYRGMGTLARWELTHDIYVTLDALTLRLQLGPTGQKLPVWENDQPAQPADVERATKQILDYFTAPVPVPAHH
ncbi:MAG TPA: hypothetical protein VFF00_09075 [Candidatus Elarobacter sp.]|nr:hypothetical protein [Candidatus Elarobacter sp.]